MDFNVWVKFHPNKTPSTYKNQPAVGPDEIAMKVLFELPEALFKRPKLQATVTVPDSAVQTEVITAETVDNIEELVKQHIGMELKVQVVLPEVEE